VDSVDLDFPETEIYGTLHRWIFSGRPASVGAGRISAVLICRQLAAVFGSELVPAAVAKRRLPRPQGRKPDRAGDPKRPTR
jgi:hypothetical protein